ncbi:MAG: hypothetical protein AAF961_12420, partial [Planctomycetota bacterium]
AKSLADSISLALSRRWETCPDSNVGPIRYGVEPTSGVGISTARSGGEASFLSPGCSAAVDFST